MQQPQDQIAEPYHARMAELEHVIRRLEEDNKCMKEKTGFKFMHQVYKQRNYTIATALPKAIVVVFVLFLALLLAFKINRV